MGSVSIHLQCRAGGLSGECRVRRFHFHAQHTGLELLNRLKAETPRVWEDEPFDFMPFHTALEYVKARKPKILYLSLGKQMSGRTRESIRNICPQLSG